MVELQSTEAGMQRIAAYWETEWEGSMPPKGKDTLKPDKDMAHKKWKLSQIRKIDGWSIPMQ